jgi:hypothetical protein
MPLDSVYLSARFERRAELNDYRVELELAGVDVTSRWLTDPPLELTDAAWPTLATQDVEDIGRAAGLVLFTEPGRPGNGARHVEFGVALGMGKRLIIVGEPENIFHRLDGVEVVPAWEDAFKIVAT